MEMTNIHPGAVNEVYKCASINLCPNTIGQVALSVMLNPPKPGDPSHDLFMREKTDELASLRRRARLVTDAFNSLDGVTCTFTEGAMYAFPKLTLPPKVRLTAYLTLHKPWQGECPSPCACCITGHIRASQTRSQSDDISHDANDTEAGWEHPHS
eukprot:366000-Chlamydomonas_euryale.AAC.11